MSLEPFLHLCPSFLLPSGRMNQNNSAGRDLKVPAGRSGQNLPTGGPASHSNPRTLHSGHLQGKPWKWRPCVVQSNKCPLLLEPPALPTWSFQNCYREKPHYLGQTRPTSSCLQLPLPSLRKDFDRWPQKPEAWLALVPSPLFTGYSCLLKLNRKKERYCLLNKVQPVWSVSSVVL